METVPPILFSDGRLESPELAIWYALRGARCWCYAHHNTPETMRECSELFRLRKHLIILLKEELAKLPQEVR